ncbi:MAG TPA: alcohol dehydrogenase family protein [Gemmatimonadales bacterium]|nr:alcohol dehydrogenase family protein [Gemmatimonadales bacterium]
MRALTYHGVRDLRVETVPDPVLIDPSDAIVAVRLAAICGSDLHIWHGRETGLDPGTVMGHEFLGEVVEVGRDVSRLARGDRVVSPFTTSCGTCFYCTHGLPARCTMGQLFGWVERGAGLHGGQAELVRVPLADTTLFPLPAELAPEAGLLLGDVLSTGWHAAVMGGVAPGAVAAVVGCGPVGLMAILAAHELGAERVFALDTVPERLALAGRFGATPVHLKELDPVATVRDATGGRGADAVLEAVGSPEATTLAFALARPGGTLAAVGVHHEAAFPFSPGAAYDKNLTYRIGRCPVRHYMDRLLPVAQRRQAELASLFTHRLPLDQAPDGYRVFDAREDGCIKVLLRP